MWNNRHGISGLCHFSIPVSDIRLSLSFYQELLGAEIYEDDLGPYALGMDEKEEGYGARPHAFLEVGRTKLELAEFPASGEQRGPGGLTWRWEPGQTPVGTHFAFSIGPNDLLPFCERLVQMNVPFWGPKTHPHTHTASVYVQDWDGNEMEFCVWDGFPGAADLPERRDDRWVQDRGFQWDPETKRATPNVPFVWDAEQMLARPKQPSTVA